MTKCYFIYIHLVGVLYVIMYCNMHFEICSILKGQSTFHFSLVWDWGYMYFKQDIHLLSNEIRIICCDICSQNNFFGLFEWPLKWILRCLLLSLIADCNFSVFLLRNRGVYPSANQLWPDSTTRKQHWAFITWSCIPKYNISALHVKLKGLNRSPGVPGVKSHLSHLMAWTSKTTSMYCSSKILKEPTENTLLHLSQLSNGFKALYFSCI